MFALDLINNNLDFYPALILQHRNRISTLLSVELNITSEVIDLAKPNTECENAIVHKLFYTFFNKNCVWISLDLSVQKNLDSLFH